MSLICNHFDRNFLLLTGWQLATLFKSQFPTLAFLSLKKPSQSGSFNRTLSMSACKSVNWSIYFWLNTSENYIAKEGCWYSQILKDKGTPLQLGLREASVYGVRLIQNLLHSVCNKPLTIASIKSSHLYLFNSYFQLWKLLKTLSAFRFDSLALYGKVHNKHFSAKPRCTEFIKFETSVDIQNMTNLLLDIKQQKGQAEAGVHLYKTMQF